MGSIVKGIGSALGLGGGGGGGARINMNRFDYRKPVQEQIKPAREATLGLVKQLQEQSQGKGPSLATAQMKAAQDRNLSQLLAAASAQRGGNTASRQRQVLQTQGDMGRQLAQDAAQARLQEQLAAQQMLGQVGVAQQGQDLASIVQPGQILAGGESARYAGDVQKQMANTQAQSQMLGSLLGAGGTVLGGMAEGGTGWFKKAEGGIVGSKKEEAKAAFAKELAKKSSTEIPVSNEPAFDYRKSIVVPEQPKKAEGGVIGSPNAESQSMFDKAIAQKMATQLPTDNEANDVVSAQLSPGEMVIPKTVVAEGPRAVQAFAEAIMKHNPTALPAQESVGGFGAIISAQQELEKRLKKLEGKKGK